ncbi:MAG: rRNA cytosine-C5-methyltransferase [Bacteroidaceae bacterium]|nr:rRNA cytosine-C5-methyltransferase [Bacteroidaceae bacterium]
MELNTEFVTRTRSLFGEERFAQFSDALNDSPVVSIRYNSVKYLPENIGNPVPWASHAEYLDTRPLFTGDPLFHAGGYYVQEASSMFLEQVVRQYVDAPVRALDLCAAPGGKSTHLLSVLPAGSMLVVNEPVSSRAQVLAENVTKWGAASVVVTKNEPCDFSKFENMFDFILVDAPCSGEGMFRKDATAVEQWSVANVQQCVKRQRTILSDVWSALAPGGLLVYSTCTFNSEENEECVSWIANELGADVLALNIPEEWGVTSNLQGGNNPVYRFIPGYTKGEGFFLSVLRKKGHPTSARMRMPRVQLCPQKIKKDIENWLVNPADFEFLLNGETIVAVPKLHLQAMQTIVDRMKILHYALPLASLKHNKPQPLHALAMSAHLNVHAFHCVDVGREAALMYLHRETLVLPDAPMGIILLTYQGVPLGFAKNVGNRANNLYPAEWRIRKNPMEL